MSSPHPSIPLLRPAMTAVAERARSAQTESQTATGTRDRWGFREFFMIGQLLLPALLYLPGTQALRVPIRVAPFALSLFGFVVLSTRDARRPQKHVAVPVLIFIILYLAVMIGMPTTNTL